MALVLLDLDAVYAGKDAMGTSSETLQVKTALMVSLRCADSAALQSPFHHHGHAENPLVLPETAQEGRVVEPSVAGLPALIQASPRIECVDQPWLLTLFPHRH